MHGSAEKTHCRRARSATVAIAFSVCAAQVPALGQDHLLSESVRPFQVTEQGDEMQAPFLGGLDEPRPQLVDIDADGDPDLFVQDRQGSVMYFANVGTASLPQFDYRSRKYMDLQVGGWFFFVDLDADDDLDIAAEQPFGRIRLFRNDGSPIVPSFTAWVDTLKDAAQEIIFTEPPTLPFLYDVDCDGRTDLMIGRQAGTITRYEMNHPDGAQPAPTFRFVEDRYGDIEVVGGSGKQIGAARRHHGASAMAFTDLDGDLTPDLLWGDFFEPNIIHFDNQGTCAAPAFQRLDDTYMRNAGTEVSTSGLNVPRPVDLDADGDMDLVVGVLGGAFVPSTTAIDNLYLFVSDAGALRLQTRRLITSIDVGSSAAPALADIDADGDFDVVIGNRIDAADPTRASLTLVRNTGSPSQPALVVESRDYLDFSGDFLATPTLADVDGDQDLDLFVGGFDGRVHFFRNSGSTATPDFVLATDSFEGIDVGAESAPAFGDIDGDGDPDLLLGESNGKINFFRNVGTPTLTQLFLETEDFAGIDVGQRSRPFLLDYDGDGDLDLLVGSESNGIAFYRNDGTPQVGEFVAADPLPVTPDVGAPAAADMDGDGDLDVIGGTSSGGLRFLRNDRLTTGVDHLPDQPKAPRIISAFPNPASSVMNFVLRSSDMTDIRVVLVDILGRTVIERRLYMSHGEVTADLPVETLARGIYVLRVETDGGFTDASKVVLQ